MKNTQTFRLNFPYDVMTLDPRKNSEYVGSTAHFMLFEGLTRMTPSSTHELGVADSVVISDDKKVYTFHLKETFWSNGSPVTAHDFAYAWKSLLEEGFPAPNAHLFYPIKNAEKIKKGILPSSELGVKALDPLTLEVTLEVPTPYFLDLTSFCPFFPVPSKIVQLHPNWADSPGQYFVTNGPFVLKKWSFKSEYIFEKNFDYWDADHVQLDRIEAFVIENELTALNLFESNEIDFYGAYCAIPSDWIPKLRNEKKLISQPCGASNILCFNLSHPLFQNKNLRKALSLAINRKSLIENITGCDETVATGAIPPLLKNSQSKIFFHDGDLALARSHFRAALDELGITKNDLETLTLSYASNVNFRRIAAEVQETWRIAFDLTIKLEELEFKILRDKLTRKDYEMAFSGWFVQYNDQMNILDRFKLKSNLLNYPGFENETYIKLLNDSAFAKSGEERFALLEKAEEILAEETPFTPLYHLNCNYLKSPKVHDLYISPIGSIHLNNVTIREDS